MGMTTQRLTIWFMAFFMVLVILQEINFPIRWRYIRSDLRRICLVITRTSLVITRIYIVLLYKSLVIIYLKRSYEALERYYLTGQYSFIVKYENLMVVFLVSWSLWLYKLYFIPWNYLCNIQHDILVIM